LAIVLPVAEFKIERCQLIVDGGIQTMKIDRSLLTAEFKCGKLSTVFNSGV
jgi:hypothetical protein